MYLLIAVLWTIVLTSNIVLAAMAVEATWSQVLAPLAVIVIDAWIAVYEYTHKK